MTLLLASVLASALSAATPAPDTAWRRHLEAPLSPGAVGLLVGHAADAAVIERWTSALGDRDPRTRAAAARAANVAGATAVLAPLVARLEDEADPTAATEELLAVAALGGAAEEARLEAAARRLGGAVAGAYVTLLCRTRGVELVEKLDGLPDGDWSKRRAVSLLTRGEEAALNRAALFALRNADAESWAAVLDLARERRRVLDRGFLASALSSKSPSIQSEAAWHVVGEQLQETPVPVTEPIQAALAASVDTPDVELAFALEVLARIRGHKPTESTTWAQWIESHDVPMYSDVLERPALRVHLTPPEAAALSVRLTGTPDGLGKNEAQARAVPTADTATPGAPPTVEVRTLDPLPDGQLGDLLRAAGCSPPSGRKMLAAEIQYGPDGRPRSVRVGPSDITGACLEAGRAALALGLAPAPEAPLAASQAVFLVFDKDWIACNTDLAAQPAKSVPADVGRPGLIQEPKKIRNVPPVYPENARRARVQGVVLLEGVIAPSGCMRSVRHRSGPGALAVAALQAVTGWTYTPTLLNGKPVPVVMTVTVNFRLN